MIEILSTIQSTTFSHETESGVSAPVPESETVVVKYATKDSGKKRTERCFKLHEKTAFLGFAMKQKVTCCTVHSACIEAKVAKNALTVGCKNMRKSAISDLIIS